MSFYSPCHYVLYSIYPESYIKANNELKNYFALFQRRKPDIDFFKFRAKLKPIIKVCNDNSIY